MKRAEIWLINLDPVIGKEISKTRPAVIVNVDSMGILPLRIIVPITGWKEHFKMATWMIKIAPNPDNNLDKTSSIDTFQIRSVSETRFIKKIGTVSPQIMKDINRGIQRVLNIPNDEKIT